MLRTSLVVLLATVSFAQSAAPPPAAPQPSAEVDSALRARIKAFYGLLVERQYRKAEEFVAPDYRDIYYENDKPRYTSFEITSISYSENFTHADVVVTTRMPPIHPMIPATTPIPTPSIWRLIDGAWYWSLKKIDALELTRALGGGVAPPGFNPGAAIPGLPGGQGANPSLPANMNLPAGLGTPQAITSMVPAGAGKPEFSLDRSSVTLKRLGTETVTVSNASPAPMTLFLLGKLRGIDAAFDRPRIGPGEKAVLSIHATGAEATGGALIIGVLENQAMINITVTVK